MKASRLTVATMILLALPVLEVAPAAAAPRRTRAAAAAKVVAPTHQARVAALGTLRPPLEERGRTKPTTAAERIADQIAALYRGPLRAGTTSLLVVDARTGAPVFAVEPDLPLNPASNVKLVSTAAALDLLGPDYRYQTRILGRSPDADGVVAGDLYLLGSYDPTLGAAQVRALGAQLAAAGVKAVTGDIVVGATATRDGIYRALIPVDIIAGAPGQPPQVSTPLGYDFLTVDVAATTGKGKKGRLTYREEYRADEVGRRRLHLTVGGKLGKGKAFTHWVWTRERGLHAAHMVRAGLRDVGVQVGGDVKIEELDGYVARAAGAGWLPFELARHQSAPLAEIVAWVNKRSINWLADRVIMTAAAQVAGEKPDMARALESMYAWLGTKAGATGGDVVLDTGSGLSSQARLSARHIVDGLRAAAASPTSGPAFMQSLSIAGQDGTLRHRFLHTPVAGRLRGKTGTLSTVIALSGFLEVAPDRPLAFAIVSNGHSPGLRTRIRGAHEKLVGLLCEYLAATAPPTAPAAIAPVAAPPVTPSSGLGLELGEEGDELGELGEPGPGAP